MKGHALLWAAAGAVILTGCSSRPRNFAPVLAAPPADQQQYEAQWLACRQQVAVTTKNGSERGVSALGGAAVGAGGAVAVGAAASTATYATYGAAAAALGATILMAPVAALGGAWGISKIKKNKKEKVIKAATADCMAKAGYSVDKWRVMTKQEVRALPITPISPAEPVTAAPVAPATATAEPK